MEPDTESFDLDQARAELDARKAAELRDALRPFIRNDEALSQAVEAALRIARDYGGYFSVLQDRERTRRRRP